MGAKEIARMERKRVLAETLREKVIAGSLGLGSDTNYFLWSTYTQPNQRNLAFGCKCYHASAIVPINLILTG